MAVIITLAWITICVIGYAIILIILWMSEKPIVSIQRDQPDSKQVIGKLTVQDSSFECDTLENLAVIVPAGIYPCKYTYSPRLSKKKLDRWLKNNPGKTEADCPLDEKNKWTYELFGVPGKTGVRIHSLNHYDESEACIGAGKRVADFNHDNEDDIQDSRNTIIAFQKEMNYKDFMLEIKDYEGGERIITKGGSFLIIRK